MQASLLVDHSQYSGYFMQASLLVDHSQYSGYFSAVLVV